MIKDWLTLLCEFIPAVERAAVVRTGSASTMAIWPEPAGLSEDWFALAAKASTKGVQYHKAEAAGHTLLTYPISNGPVVFAILCLQLPLAESQKPTVESLIRWAVSWLAVYGKASREKSAGFEQVLTLLEQGSQHANIADSGAMLATSMVELFQLPQVFIVAKNNNQFRVVASSHTPKFDRRAEVFQQLEAFLNERDSEAAEAMLAAYKTWLAQQSMPLELHLFALEADGQVYGYIVPFNSPDNPLRSTTKAQIGLIARQLAPLYAQLAQQHDGLLWRFVGKVQSRFAGHKKLYWAVIVALIAAVCFIPLSHQVTADASLEGRIQRAIVAPEDGFIAASYVEAGEVIREGQIIADLDDKTIRLEIARWQSEKQEYEREFGRELNALNHAQMRIAKARIAQAEAQLNLFRQQLERVHIRSPIDGVIIQGDLSRSIGSPVKRGQLLFEIAPQDEFRLVMQVQEQDIQYLSNGVTGRLVLHADSDRRLAFEVSNVSSIYSEHENGIAYRVEAELIQAANLRPGMTGIAKLTVGKKPLIWLVGHRFWDWLTVKWWEFTGL